MLQVLGESWDHSFSLVIWQELFGSQLPWRSGLAPEHHWCSICSQSVGQLAVSDSSSGQWLLWYQGQILPSPHVLALCHGASLTTHFQGSSPNPCSWDMRCWQNYGLSAQGFWKFPQGNQPDYKSGSTNDLLWVSASHCSDSREPFWNMKIRLQVCPT